ncbi:MAG: G1 family glutamic endopeptidase [Acidimicrobiales bacterium]
MVFPTTTTGAGLPGDSFPVGGSTLDRPETDARSWGPTLLFCAALLLSAILIVVAKPLSAGAATTGHRSHGTVASRSRKVEQVNPGEATSPNWSGYVAYESGNDAGFDQVSAQWVEPAVTCPKKNAWTLFWVGFDGWPAGQPSMDESVEQGGTSAQCLNGVPHYNAFYEMWPTTAVKMTIPVNAGDQIAASVTYSAATNFTITVTDVTTGQTATNSGSCVGTGLACARTSAEWVAESPSHYGAKKPSWFPMAKFATTEFTDAWASDNQGVTGPIANSPAWQSSGIIRVAGRAKPVAVVSALQSTSFSSVFSDTYRK